MREVAQRAVDDPIGEQPDRAVLLGEPYEELGIGEGPGRRGPP